MTQLLFIYAKEGMIRCLNGNDSIKENPIAEGWTHTATIDPAKWIEAMANGQRDPSDMLDEIQFKNL